MDTMTDITEPISIVEGHAEISTAPQGDAPSPLPDFMTVVPEKYREAQWVKETAKSEKPYESLFNQFENAQKTIGEKSKALEIPGPDAPPEKVKEFRKAMGVPEKPEGYEYTPPDISKEPEPVQAILKARSEDQTFINTMRQKALDAGITPAQFTALAAEFDGLTVAQVRAQVGAQTAQIEANRVKRDASIKQLYGDAAPSIIKTADEILMNPNVVPEVVRKTGDSGILNIALMNYIHEKMFKNDKVGAANQGAPPMTAASIRAKILELTSKPEYSDFQKPGHKALKVQVEALYEEEHRMKQNKIE